MISREPSYSISADGIVGSWSALFFLDCNSDQGPINAIFGVGVVFRTITILIRVSITFCIQVSSSPLNS